MPDYTIPLQFQQPNTLGALGNMVNTAQGIQAFQTGQIAQQRLGINLQSELQANQERKNVIQAMQSNDPDLMPGPDGIIPQAQALAKLQQLAPQTWSQYASNINTTNSQATTVNRQLMDLGQERLQGLGEALTSKVGRPASEVAQAVNDWAEANPQGKKVANLFLDSLNKAGENQDMVTAVTRHASLRANALASQIEATTPGLTIVGTGQTAQPVVTAQRLTQLPIGAQVGPGVQMTVPPTATTMVGGQPQYVGVRPNQGPGTAPIPAAAMLGQPELAAGGAGVINQHFGALQAGAAQSSMFEGIARNIQNLAPKAITGTEADKLAFVNGILAQITPGQALPDNLKTATDLLQKNMSMLNLQGDTATNFKTSITQLAQPHGTMSPTAMRDAASQLIGQARMKQSLAGYFAPDFAYATTTGDQSHYMGKLQAVNPLTDPRAWEFASLPPEDQKRFRARLSPQDDAELGAKYKRLKALGLIQ